MEEQVLDPMTALTVEMRYMRADLSELKQDMKDLKDRPCPSELCMQCQTDIAALKTTEANRKDSGASAVAWVGLITAMIAAAAAVFALGM